MSDHPITLTVPDYVYTQAERVAKATAQPIESVLRQRLEEAFADPRSRLPLDEQAELEALKHLSDDTLWTIARGTDATPSAGADADADGSEFQRLYHH